MGHIHDNSSKVLSSAASAHLTCFCQCTIFQIINLSVLSSFCISLLCFTFNSVHSLRSLWHRYSNWRPLYSPSILTSATIFYIYTFCSSCTYHIEMKERKSHYKSIQRDFDWSLLPYMEHFYPDKSSAKQCPPPQGTRIRWIVWLIWK